MKHISSLSCALAALGLLVACGPSQRGPDIKGPWRNAPEDLPYTGTMPVVKTVSFNVNLASEEGVVTEGTGSISPFYSSDEVEHVAPDEHQTAAFTWKVVDEKHITWDLKGGEASCTGEITEDGLHIDMTVAGCPPLAERVGAKTVRFDRRN